MASTAFLLVFKFCFMYPKILVSLVLLVLWYCLQLWLCLFKVSV